MIYSKLYNKYYPFNACSDIYALSQEEMSRLIHYIKHYPGHISDKLLSARRYGIKVEGWEETKGWKASLKSSVLPSTGLVDVLIEMQNKCNNIISKIEKAQPLTAGDLANINRILYANKYCWLLSIFLCPTPDGRASAIFE